ncbi:MAG: transcriptional repressor [Gammaproteobacteria bacterium]|nr:transcriptional repressor [Gammaproteobacteria bacterium]
MQREEVVRVLGRNGITITPQRVEVGEVLFSRAQHVSAEQIIDEIKQHGKSVSKATVYNTLNRFVAKGIAKAVHVNPERTFYDSVITYHHHFYNEDTHEITDIDPASLVIQQMPEIPPGTELQDIEVVIHVRNKQDI